MKKKKEKVKITTHYRSFGTVLAYNSNGKRAYPANLNIQATYSKLMKVNEEMLRDGSLLDAEDCLLPLVGAVLLVIKIQRCKMKGADWTHTSSRVRYIGRLTKNEKQLLLTDIYERHNP